MMETKSNADSALKEALARRMTGGLPSNFTYRTMQQVQQEAVRKRKRQRLAIWASLIGASLFILGMLVYFLFFYLDFNIADYRPEPDTGAPSRMLMNFYWYIGSLVVVLLALDYWVRNKVRKSLTE